MRGAGLQVREDVDRLLAQRIVMDVRRLVDEEVQARPDERGPLRQGLRRRVAGTARIGLGGQRHHEGAGGERECAHARDESTNLVVRGTAPGWVESGRILGRRRDSGVTPVRVCTSAIGKGLRP